MAAAAGQPAVLLEASAFDEEDQSPDLLLPCPCQHTRASCSSAAVHARLEHRAVSPLIPAPKQGPPHL